MSLRGYVSMGTGPDADLVLHFTAGPTDVLNDPRVDTLLGFFPVEDREICSRVMAACEESDDYADAEEKATVVGTCLSMLRQMYEV